MKYVLEVIHMLELLARRRSDEFSNVSQIESVYEFPITGWLRNGVACTICLMTSRIVKHTQIVATYTQDKKYFRPHDYRIN